MSRSAWSIAALSVLAMSLGVTAPGCIGKRRPQAQQHKAEQGGGRLIQPQDVDGALDAAIEGERLLAVYDERDPAKGAALPLVTIVEYSDFQCPYCTRLAESMDQVVGDYPRDVKLVFKQFPLPFHPQAEPAARAALAAHEQGRFWEMHDQMFANQKALSDSQLEGYAKAIGLDVERWRKDFMSDEVRKHVVSETTAGSPLGVRGTPSFFINGKFYSGAMAPEQLRSLIDGELLEARKLLAAGAKREELYARFLHAAAAKAADTPAVEAKPKPGPEVKPTPNKPEPKAAPTKGFVAERRYAIPVGEGLPARGPANALVTIVEFGAFDCEQCRSVQGALDRVLAKYPREVRLVFRSLDESNRARRGARIAFAAHKQDQFWKVHDALMKFDDDFTTDSAAKLITRLGLDAETFGKDLRDLEAGSASEMIKADHAVIDALRADDDAAPLLFVNGRFLDGSATFEQLDALVVDEKAKAQAFLAKTPGANRGSLYEAMRRTWEGADALPKGK